MNRKYENTTLTLTFQQVCALAVALPQIERIDIGTRSELVRLEIRISKLLEANGIINPRDFYGGGDECDD